MTAPFQQNGSPAPVKVVPNFDELVNDLGNAAQQMATKGAMADDGGQAKDYGAAALAYVQALMLIVAPKVAPQRSDVTTPPGSSGSA